MAMYSQVCRAEYYIDRNGQFKRYAYEYPPRTKFLWQTTEDSIYDEWIPELPNHVDFVSNAVERVEADQRLLIPGPDWYSFVNATDTTPRYFDFKLDVSKYRMDNTNRWVLMTNVQIVRGPNTAGEFPVNGWTSSMTVNEIFDGFDSEDPVISADRYVVAATQIAHGFPKTTPGNLHLRIYPPPTPFNSGTLSVFINLLVFRLGLQLVGEYHPNYTNPPQ